MSSMIKVLEKIPLAPLTTFKIGGPARFFVRVFSEKELKKAWEFARENKLKVFVLGGGSNILVADSGFEGLVLKIEERDFKIEGARIKVGAGMELDRVVKLAQDNSLEGLEFASGIPGTVGGAIRGNAGAFGWSIKEVLEKVRVFDTKKKKLYWLKNKECAFSYRHSLFKENPELVITTAIFSLRRGLRSKIKERREKYLQKRAHLPTLPSAGCVFKNPEYKKVRKRLRVRAPMKKELIEILERTKGKIPVGWMVDKLGLKGTKVGGCQISPEHGNIIVNTGGGKAEDVLSLISLIKDRVKKEFNLLLEEEISYVGFE